ncbi:hypothetical protein B4U80_00221 [Leptotrombidium deliense]|uniref:RNA-directed DNA polymerase n=1 Tax=Leptotrombidium deliense TaxID=299467 RepID=A0A443SHA5_9ACAR|nr:hypothetical protein B4U80_00221 [Leptotrombidium deliense]
MFPQYFMLPAPQASQLSLPSSTQSSSQAGQSHVSVSEASQQQFPGYFCNSVLVNLLGDETPMTKPVFVNGTIIDCIIDTGSGINIINYTFAEKLKLEIRNYTGPQLFAANNTKIVPFGETSVTVTLFPSGIKREIVIDAMVTRNIPYSFLLGRDGLIKANILIDVTENELIAKEFQFEDNYFDDYDFPKSKDVKCTISTCLKPLETKIIPATCEDEISFTSLISSASTFLDVEQIESVNSDLNFRVTNVTDECVYLSPGTTFALTIDLDCDNQEFNEEVRKVNIGANRSDEEREKIMNVIREKRKAFAFKPDEIGRTHIMEHQINLIPNVLPIKSAPYRCSPKEKESLNADIEKMIKMGICEVSESDWASPIVIILKEDDSSPGNVKRRFTTDFRKLNNVTIKDPYPMPLASDIFPCFAGAKVFTRLDLNNGFWQIPLRETDTDYTSFITPDGLFKYKMMAMGLCNAPASFCRTMDKLLGKHKWHGVVVYVDDLLIYSPDMISHLFLFIDILDLFIDANLTLRPSKCTFATDSIIMLGFVIDTNGIKPNPKAVEKILKVPFPETLKDLRSFCGLVTFFNKLYPNFAKDMCPLYAMQKKGNFVKTEKAVIAFEKVKQTMASEPFVAHFTPEQATRIEIHCDASGYAMGSVLLMEKDSQLHPCEYFSRLFRGAEIYYCVWEKEACAAVCSCVRFRPRILGYHFYLRTDHMSLIYLLKMNNPPPRCARWLMILSEFDFEVIYVSGKVNNDADFFSRFPVDDDGLTVQQFVDIDRLFAFAIVTESDPKLDFAKEQRRDALLNSIIEQLEDDCEIPNNRDVES